MNVLPCGATAVRAALISGVTIAVSACAGEPVANQHAFGPIMMLNGPATLSDKTIPGEPADPMHELSKKSLAAKVLTSRALETVTGLPIDPARLSEHD